MTPETIFSLELLPFYLQSLPSIGTHHMRFLSSSKILVLFIELMAGDCITCVKSLSETYLKQQKEKHSNVVEVNHS